MAKLGKKTSCKSKWSGSTPDIRLLNTQLQTRTKNQFKIVPKLNLVLKCWRRKRLPHIFILEPNSEHHIVSSVQKKNSHCNLVTSSGNRNEVRFSSLP